MKYLAIVALLAMGGCSDRQGHARAENGGTLVIVTTADPGSLFPPLIITSEAKQIGERTEVRFPRESPLATGAPREGRLR